MTERSPKTLDEALCITLRLEAWAKSVKQDRLEDDQIDRPRQKARATAKPEPVKANYHPESSDRMAKIEADMSKLREEIRKLRYPPQTPSPSTAILSIPPATAPFQRPGAKVTNSAGEGPPSHDARIKGPVRPLMQNIPPQQRQPLLCWDCGFPGHIKRDCPTRSAHRN